MTETRVYSIGLTTTAEVDDDTFALIFSIAEPDIEGDGYSLVVEPGQRCAYRCVESCGLVSGRLHLELGQEAAGVLGLPRELTIALELSEPELLLLRLGLARVGIDAA